MSFSLFVRKALRCWAVALLFPGLVFAQQVFPPNAGEYCVTGPRPGDQVHPQASISPLGGFLVWEDNATDWGGTGINALALNSALAKVQTPFRVNQLTYGDQQIPQVALLPGGGGAVFVWQGGQAGRQNIYARFLSSSNTWLSGDLLVNSFTGNGFRKNPAVAVLNNGNVVIVYGSYNQLSTNSMQDVYGQILTPAGQKLGNEFLVNIFTPFNQRAPAVAALAGGGGFVVVWVSEQENSTVGNLSATIPVQSQVPPGLPSVDIYARFYDATGTPVSNEIQVSTDPAPCGEPCVAAGPGGGAMVVWSERDLVTLANGLDIYARALSASGAGGLVHRVNSYVLGDQYAPQVSAAGTNYLAVWTSVGQDGSGLGVYGRFLDADGGVLENEEFRVNTTTAKDQMHAAVASDGSNRFLAVWTSYVGGVNSFDIYGQVYASPNYAPPPVTVYAPPAYDPFLTAPPATPNPTTGPPPPVAGAPASLEIPTVLLPGGPLSNAFVLAQGSYNGLVSDTNGASAASSGFFSATVTRGGAYTAKLVVSNQTYTASGRFDATTGADSRALKGGAKAPALSAQLQLDLATGDQISGQVAAGSGWTAQLLAFRQGYNAATNPATPLAGSYTLVIRPSTPGGLGYGTVKIDKSGNVQWSGFLADGTAVSQSATLSRQGYWPLYASADGGGAVLMSWVQFTNQPDCDLYGQSVWLKPATPRAKMARAAFTNELTVIGSAYSAPAAAAALAGLGQGTLVLDGADVGGSATYLFSLNKQDQVVLPAASKLKLGLNLGSGLFNGSVSLAPAHSLSFQGVFLPKLTNGWGYFQGTNQAGQVFLGPQAAAGQ